MTTASQSQFPVDSDSQLKSAAKRWLSHTGKILIWVWSVLTVALLTWGWVNRDQGYLTPERGLGYWLGITGGVMLLLLLLYSLRKRTRLLKNWLPTRIWFQFHMSMGIIGPLFIIFHSNFHLGSLNSSIALICMVVVSASGLIGRFLYTRIHFGLYGEKIRLREINKDFTALKEDFTRLAVSDRQIATFERLFSEVGELIDMQSSQQSILAVRASRKRADKIASALKEFIQQLVDYYAKRPNPTINPGTLQAALDRDSAILLAVLRKLPSLQLSERLFSLWHVFHIPFFTLMIITAITHVVVVHMY